MFVYVQASQGAYLLQFAPYAEQAFWSTPPEIRGQIRRRLEEIADVAGHLVSTVADSVGNTLRLEMSGHIISYVLSDVERTLTVVSVVSFAAQGRAANG